MPIFGSSRIIGLDIGDASVEAVLVDVSARVPVWISRARVELPPGLVERGLVRDAKALGAVLRDLLAKGVPRPIAGHDVVVNVPDQQSVARLLRLERPVPRERLAAAVATDAAGFVPYPFDDVRLDYQLLGEPGKGKAVFYAAAPEVALKNIEAALAAAGLTVGAFDLETLALARLFSGAPGEGAHLVLDVGAEVTTVSIVDGASLQRTAVVDFGADDLARALAAKEGISEDKAELLKRKAGFQPDAAGGRIFFVLQKEIQQLIEEIRRSVGEFERNVGAKVGRMTVAGGGALTPGLPEYVGGALGIPVQLGDAVTAGLVAVSEAVPREDAVLYANALGLAVSQRPSPFPHLSFQRKERIMKPHPAPEGGRPEGETALVPAVPPKKRAKLPKRRVRLLIAAGVLAVVLGLGAAAWALFFRGADGGGTVVLPGAVTVSFPVALRFAGAEEGDGLAATLLTHTATLRRPISVEGSAETPALATGTVTLVNDSGADQPLVERTRLLSEDGILFRLREAVTVPAGGDVAAAVIADQPGAEGDVGPGRFTIPGLPTARQAEVYGRSEQAMSGGVQVSGAVSDAEIQRALAAVREDLTLAALSAWREALAPGEVLSSVPIGIRFTASRIPEAGPVTEAPVVEVTAEVTGATVTEAALVAVADAAVAAEAGVESAAGAYLYTGWQLTVEAYDESAHTGAATVRVEAERTN